MTPSVSTDVGPARPAVDSAPATTRRAWIAGFLLVFGMLAAWSIATPIYAAPDEQAHTYRAASLVRGELLGEDVSKPQDPIVLVQVPSELTSWHPSCFAFRASVPASCMSTTLDPPGLESVTTYTGRYPPLYYVVVGMPSLLPLGASMLIWMRLAGDLVNALFLTAAFLLLGRRRRCWWAIVGGAVAMTPMVIFIGAVVNPSGLEISSATALWSALLCWGITPNRAPDRVTLGWAAVSAVVFESTRGLSPVFMLITVALGVIVAGWSSWQVPARLRDVRVAGAVVAGFGAIAAIWVVVAGALRLSRTRPLPSSESTGSLIRLVLHQSTQFRGFVGQFGWLETAAPRWVVQLWGYAAVGLLVGVALGRVWRSLLVIALVLAATILIPSVGDLLEARTIGLISQPRYILPLAVGTMLVAGSAIRWPGRWSRMTAQLVLAALAAAQIAAFVRALQRYRTGVGAGAGPGLPEWYPPLGSGAVTALFVLAAAGFLVWLWRLGQSTDSGR